MQMSLVRLTAGNDIQGLLFSIAFVLLQFSSDVNKINPGETKHDDTHEGTLMFHCLERLQYVPRIRDDWEVFGKVAWHHTSGFIVPASSSGTITFTLFFRPSAP